mmetsp:Transcript_63816/g.138263  ORF Transcript_63816/g.138263 Transcript_63816/m.138263 type:complete len:151 (-) Transcript_63816:700-1152(-)
MIIDDTVKVEAVVPPKDKPAEQQAPSTTPIATPQAQAPKNTATPQSTVVTPVQQPQAPTQAPKKAAPQEIPTKFVLDMSKRTEHREKMSVLRRKVAIRLKSSQNQNALLTTFNEIDMGHIIDVRSKFQDEFTKTHGIKLGFMGFFLKASS